MSKGRRNREAAAAAAADGDDGSHEPEPSGGSGRAWKIAAVVSVVVAVAVLGVLASLLVGAGGSEPAKDVRACIPDRNFTKGKKPRCPPAGVPYVDGLVGDTTGTGFDLRGMDGSQHHFTVRGPDKPYIDVQHAQTHASLGQPVRIYHRKIDGRDSVVYMVDSPLQF